MMSENAKPSIPLPQHNFLIGPTDTDSISFCKPDKTPFTKEELAILLKEINELSPDLITWEDDGYYKKCIVLKAKNYILFDPTKEKESDRKQVKGSAFKSAKKEPFVATMMQDMVEALLLDKNGQLVSIYESYVQKVLNVKTPDDLMGWCSKVTVSDKVLACRGHEQYTKEEKKLKGIRTNETNVWDAVKREELVQQGDKVFLFPAILSRTPVSTSKTLKSGKEKVTTKVEVVDGLLLPKHWDGSNHDVQHLLKRLYDTVKIFQNILDLEPYLNYSLVKNFKILLDRQAALAYTAL